MYHAFFGLQKAPFHLTPDPEFLYLTPQHREALAGLTYAILSRKGFVVLTGNAGTGKTTLLARILAHLPVSRVQSSVIVNPTLTPSEFLEAALMDFGFKDIPASKAQRVSILQNFLWRGQRQGKVSALIIDEAHKLTGEVLEEIRLLGNFESANEKLLQVVLVGQKELDDLLNRESLRQFKQRVSLRLAIDPLSPSEVERYIRHRWTTAGGNRCPFTANALAAIADASEGIPRVINVLCDGSLIQAFADESPSVEFRHVLAVCRELQLDEPMPRSRALEPPVIPAPLVLATAAPAPFAEAPLLEPIALEAPAAAPLAVEPSPLKSLQRYDTEPPKLSLLARLTGKRPRIPSKD
jgi:general secretion pathway protein A